MADERWMLWSLSNGAPVASIWNRDPRSSMDWKTFWQPNVTGVPFRLLAADSALTLDALIARYPYRRGGPPAEPVAADPAPRPPSPLPGGSRPDGAAAVSALEFWA